MTMLGKTDGSDDGSYAEIASVLRRVGAPGHIETDIIELWKRVVFSELVNNTDDHLRNHAFLLTDNGWKLTPLYDINPSPVWGDSLPLWSGCYERNMNNIMKLADRLGLDESTCRNYIDFASETIHTKLERYMDKYNISSPERKIMSRAFIPPETFRLSNTIH